VPAIESGWAQQQIADASWALQRQIEQGERIVVGVNRFVDDESRPTAIHRHAERFEQEQAAALRSLRAERDQARVTEALEQLRAAAASNTNLVPVLVETVKTYATTGEIFGVLREAFGEHRAVAVY
jgi:methylmalonyl-CoA mutase N-terminal domain/subunit